MAKYTLKKDMDTGRWWAYNDRNSLMVDVGGSADAEECEVKLRQYVGSRKAITPEPDRIVEIP